MSDTKFGNEIFLSQGVLGPGVEKYCEEKLEVMVNHKNLSINPSWTINNYSKIKGKPEYVLYISSDRYLNGSDERIRQLSSSILGSENNLERIVKRLYGYTVENLNYGNPIRGLYTFRDALNKKVVDCGGFASLLGSLLKSVGVPSRVVVGFWLDSYKGRADKKMHAWLEILLPDGVWLTLDPAVEHLRRHGRSKRVGGFGVIGNDRIIFSYGSEITFKIANQDLTLDILQNPVILAEKGENSMEEKINFVVQKI